MSTKARRNSIEAFMSVQRRLVSCVTNAVVLESRRLQGTPFAVLGEASPIPVRSRSELAFSVLLGFDVRNEHASGPLPRGVVVTDYAFEVYRNAAEFLIYHLHPMGLSWMAEPHLHVKGPIAGVD